MRLVVDGLIFQKDPHGGIARYFREILPRMCDQSQDLEIILFVDGELRSAIPEHSRIHLKQTLKVRPVLRPKGIWRSLLFPIRRLGGGFWNQARQVWLKGEEEAIWHSTFYTFPPKWKGPEVVTVHDLILERYRDHFNDPLDEIARNRMRLCIARAAAVICDSQSTKNDLLNQYPLQEKLIEVIYLGCSDVFRLDSSACQVMSHSPHEPFFLYIGNRGKYKNFQGLLNAFAQWEKHAEYSLQVIGPQWEPDEIQSIEGLNLTGKVHRVGYVGDEELCQFYNRAIALIFPSYWEGFGLPVLEAMASGCPVVASKIPTTVEVAGDVPFYFNPDSAEEMIAALEASISEGRSTQRVQAGLDRAKLFSWDHTAGKTLEIYRRLETIRSSKAH